MVKQKVIRTKNIIFIMIAVVAVSLCSGCSRSENQANYQDTGFAMGTVISQNIYGANGEQLSKKVLDIITNLENVISWRIDGTVVNLLNQVAGEGNGVPFTNKDFADWIKKCLDVYEKSGGLLDITVGPAARLWDIGGENPRIPETEELKEALKLIDSSKIRLSDTDDTIWFDTKGGQLDLGAVGKGIACDEIREYLDDNVPEIGGTFSVGGSVLIYGTKPKDEPWKIGIQDPRDKTGSYMVALTIGQGKGDALFVSTSGDYEKYFEEGGVRYHHILDPRTGAPADSDLISVTIISDSGFVSDALSTACFVAGSEKAMELADVYDAGIIMVDKEKKVYASEKAQTMCTILNEAYQLSENE